MTTRGAVEGVVDGMNERDKIPVVLNSHVQSVRSGHCECGWRATFPDPRYPIGAEHFQHREHLADEITAALGK